MNEGERKIKVTTPDGEIEELALDDVLPTLDEVTESMVSSRKEMEKRNSSNSFSGISSRDIDVIVDGIKPDESEKPTIDDLPDSTNNEPSKGFFDEKDLELKTNDHPTSDHNKGVGDESKDG